MIDPDRVLELLNPPTFTVAEARDVIGRILRREDTGALVEACSDLYLRLSGEGPNRPDLIWLCCDALRAGPLVRGAMLREGWIDGRHGGKLARAGYSKTKILAWFRAASPETLMCAEEREFLHKLADQVTAYRGGPGPTPRKASAGVSWTLD